MSTLERTPPHSHIRHFFNALWTIFYEDIWEKYFILPRLKKEQEAAEKELNLLKVRENDPLVNRSRFRVITNEKILKEHRKRNE